MYTRVVLVVVKHRWPSRGESIAMGGSPLPEYLNSANGASTCCHSAPAVGAQAGVQVQRCRTLLGNSARKLTMGSGQGLSAALTQKHSFVAPLRVRVAARKPRQAIAAPPGSMTSPALPVRAASARTRCAPPRRSA